MAHMYVLHSANMAYVSYEGGTEIYKTSQADCQHGKDAAPSVSSFFFYLFFYFFIPLSGVLPFWPENTVCCQGI